MAKRKRQKVTMMMRVMSGTTILIEIPIPPSKRRSLISKLKASLNEGKISKAEMILNPDYNILVIHL